MLEPRLKPRAPVLSSLPSHCLQDVQHRHCVVYVLWNLNDIPSTLHWLSLFISRQLFRCSSLEPGVLIATDGLLAELEGRQQLKQSRLFLFAFRVGQQNVHWSGACTLMKHLGMHSASAAGLGSPSGRATGSTCTNSLSDYPSEAFLSKPTANLEMPPHPPPKASPLQVSALLSFPTCMGAT